MHKFIEAHGLTFNTSVLCAVTPDLLVIDSGMLNKYFHGFQDEDRFKEVLAELGFVNIGKYKPFLVNPEKVSAVLNNHGCTKVVFNGACLFTDSTFKEVEDILQNLVNIDTKGDFYTDLLVNKNTTFTRDGSSVTLTHPKLRDFTLMETYESLLFKLTSK